MVSFSAEGYCAVVVHTRDKLLMFVQLIITADGFLGNIIPLYLLSQCLFGDFPINTTL